MYLRELTQDFILNGKALTIAVFFIIRKKLPLNTYELTLHIQGILYNYKFKKRDHRLRLSCKQKK